MKSIEKMVFWTRRSVSVRVTLSGRADAAPAPVDHATAGRSSIVLNCLTGRAQAVLLLTREGFDRNLLLRHSRYHPLTKQLRLPSETLVELSEAISATFRFSSDS
ncbi:hypothetical protein J6590_021104 [Homalodisca vitripennis]|nr:hypothetical protein J6590_021104 [Homalodisca vitripennis]